MRGLLCGRTQATRRTLRKFSRLLEPGIIDMECLVANSLSCFSVTGRLELDPKLATSLIACGYQPAYYCLITLGGFFDVAKARFAMTMYDISCVLDVQYGIKSALPKGCTLYCCLGLIIELVVVVAHVNVPSRIVDNNKRGHIHSK